jgi:hypothetical protein
MGLFDKVKSKGKKVIGYPSKDDPRVVSSKVWINHVKAKIDVSSPLSQSSLETQSHPQPVGYVISLFPIFQWIAVSAS